MRLNQLAFFLLLPLFLLSCSKSFEQSEAKRELQRQLPYFVCVEDFSGGAFVENSANGETYFEMPFSATVRMMDNTFKLDEAQGKGESSKVVYVKPVLKKDKTLEISGTIRKYFRKSGEAYFVEFDMFDMAYFGTPMYDLKGKGTIVERGSSEEDKIKESQANAGEKFKEMLSNSVWNVSSFDKNFNRGTAYFYSNGDFLFDWTIPVRFDYGKWNLKGDELVIKITTSGKQDVVKWTATFKVDTFRNGNAKHPEFKCVNSTGKSFNFSADFAKSLGESVSERNIALYGDWLWTSKEVEIPTPALSRTKFANIKKAKNLNVISSYNSDGTFEHNFFYVNGDKVYFANRIGGKYLCSGKDIVEETITHIGGKPVKKTLTSERIVYKFSTKQINNVRTFFTEKKFAKYEPMNNAAFLQIEDFRFIPTGFLNFESTLANSEKDVFFENLQGLIFSENEAFLKLFGELSNTAMQTFAEYKKLAAASPEAQKSEKEIFKKGALAEFEKKLSQTREAFFLKANGLPKYEFNTYCALLRVYDVELLWLIAFGD